MNRVTHFEISCDDPERAAKFYTDVFGWKIRKWDGPVDYWLATTGEGGVGINGGLMKREKPGDSTCNTMDVPDLDEAIKNITANGGEVVGPKMAVPGVGWMAYCKDTEGNVFGLMQEDAEAK